MEKFNCLMLVEGNTEQGKLGLVGVKEPFIAEISLT